MTPWAHVWRSRPAGRRCVCCGRDVGDSRIAVYDPQHNRCGAACRKCVGELIKGPEVITEQVQEETRA